MRRFVTFFTILSISLFLSGAITVSASPSDDIDLLIIYPEGSSSEERLDWATYANAFASYKSFTGVSATTLGVYDILRAQSAYSGDTPKKIKRVIYWKKYNHNIKYVLLVGDADVFPVRYQFLGHSTVNGGNIRNIRDRKLFNIVINVIAIQASLHTCSGPGCDIPDELGNEFVNHGIVILAITAVLQDGDDWIIETTGTSYRIKEKTDGAGNVYLEVRCCGHAYGSAYGFQPCDSYYANLWHGDHRTIFDDWNENGDQLIGEMYRNNFRGVDNISIHPEVAVGRIPCHTPQEFLDYICKVMSYEREISTWESFQSGLFLAGTYTGSTSTKVDIGTILGPDWDITYVEKRVPGEYYVNDARSGYIDADMPDCISAWIGQFINYAGHGAPDSWGEVSFNDIAAAALSNRPAIACTASCSTGKFAGGRGYETKPEVLAALAADPNYFENFPNSNSMAEAFLNNPAGGGVVYIGSVTSVQGPSQNLERFFFQAIADGAETAGDAWMQATEEFIDHYHLDSVNETPETSDYCNDRYWHWPDLAEFRHIFKTHFFGDPSLRINGIEEMPADDIPPETSASVIDSEGHAGVHWLNQRETRVRFTASDSGSGVLKTEYQVKAAEAALWGPWNIGCYCDFDNQQVSDGGQATVRYRSCDVAGNRETNKEVQIRYDFTPPELHMEVDGELDPVGTPEPGYRQPVSVRIWAEDSTSGVQHISYKIGNGRWRWEWGDEVEFSLDCMPYNSVTIRSYADDYAGNFTEERNDILLAPVGAVEFSQRCLVVAPQWATRELWSEREMLCPPQGRHDVLMFKFYEDYASVIPDSVRFDFRGPFTVENENPAWQTMGWAAKKGHEWQILWDSRRAGAVNGWYEVRAVPKLGKPMMNSLSSAEEENLLIFIDNISDENYNFEVNCDQKHLKPGEKLVVNASFSQDLGALHNLRLGLFLDHDLFEEKEDEFYVRERESLKGQEKWEESFQLTLLPELSQTDEIEVIAYVRSDEVNYLRSKASSFSIIYRDISVSGRVSDTLGKPLSAILLLQKEGWDREVETGEDGSYLFTNVPMGDYILSATPSSAEYRQVLPQGNPEIFSRGKNITRDFVFALKDKVSPWITQEFSWREVVEYGYLLGLVADNCWGTGIGEVKLALRDEAQDRWWNPEDGSWNEEEFWFYPLDLRPIGDFLDLYFDTMFEELPTERKEGIRRMLENWRARSDPSQPIWVWFYSLENPSLLEEGWKLIKARASDFSGNVGYDETVNSILKASFKAVPQDGDPLTYRFQDTSTGLVQEKAWDFGDGTTSSLCNPTHTYASPGTYEVRLSINGPYSSDVAIKSIEAGGPKFPVEGGPLSISVSTSATQVCGAEYSHELKVAWKVSGGKPPIDVTIEITRPDGSVESVGVSELEGERTFQMNYPAGGTVGVKVQAQDAGGSSASASASASLSPCQ